MKLHHVALWTTDLDRLSAFWREMFGARVGEVYISANTPGFSSRSITFDDIPFLELMCLPTLGDVATGIRPGYAHIAIALGSAAAVDAMATRAGAASRLVAAPRWTGDGFYEAVIADPDGNRIEITI